MSDPVFTLRNVSKKRTRGPGYALSIPRLDIAAGSRVAITGPSGSGKSTLLDILGMALRPDTAERFVMHAGEFSMDVAAAWRSGNQDALSSIRLRHLGYILQTGGLLPYLNVAENIGLTADLNDMPNTGSLVHEVASALGIERLLRAMPGQLSIGERQRVAIGRALASKPSVILADEPTAALDPYHAQAVLDMLLESTGHYGVTLILVTHDQGMLKSRGLDELRISITHRQNGVLATLET